LPTKTGISCGPWPIIDYLMKKILDINKKHTADFFILAKIKTGAKAASIIEIEPFDRKRCFKISLKSQPVENKANSELVKLLAKNFNTAMNKIKIVRGKKDKKKVIKINL
jgi:uncharacterized protein